MLGLPKINQKKESMNTKERLLNTKEAAEFLGVSRQTVYKLVHTKRLTYYCPSGKLNFFDIEDLKAFQKRGRVLSEADQAKEMAMSNI